MEQNKHFLMEHFSHEKAPGFQWTANIVTNITPLFFLIHANKSHAAKFSKSVQ